MDHPNSQRALAYFDELFPLDPSPMATQLQHAPPRQDIIADILAFDGFGAATVSEKKGNIPYFVNEFWTSGQRQAHSIHEVSYRACFKAQLPEFFISRLTVGERDFFIDDVRQLVVHVATGIEVDARGDERHHAKHQHG